MPIMPARLCQSLAGGRIANVDTNYTKLVYPELSYRLSGILFAVHNELGRYANEKQYSDAIETKLKQLAITYEREQILPPSFGKESVGRNRIDFIVDDKIILEIKTKRIIGREEYYQIRRYLKAMSKNSEFS